MIAHRVVEGINTAVDINRAEEIETHVLSGAGHFRNPAGKKKVD